MSVSRARKQAAAKLGGEIQMRYQRLVTAVGQDEIAIAATDLGMIFNDNVEFIIWALKTYGGLNPKPPERVKRPAPVPPPAANDLPVLSADLVKPSGKAAKIVPSACVCPPLEPGIIGPKHMASCPEFEP